MLETRASTAIPQGGVHKPKATRPTEYPWKRVLAFLPRRVAVAAITKIAEGRALIIA